jgi:hypothetical protein
VAGWADELSRVGDVDCSGAGVGVTLGAAGAVLVCGGVLVAAGVSLAAGWFELTGADVAG